ncbi:PAS domain-containing protein [Rhodospira trueperi]|uniref:PAS domain-containing protein n=1 Tax=Rhodospira trueperi TaxID=69960 RepID=UPI0015A410F9|nr:PAS domain-containing protein [Rhodospira trueperi]
MLGADVGEQQAVFSGAPAVTEAEILACVDFAGMRDLLQDLRDMTGLSAAVLDRAGRVVVASDSTALCAMYLEEGSPSRQTCLENKREMARRLTGDEDAVIQACPLGLTECVSRIEVDGIHIANLMIGQFLTAAPDPDRVAEMGGTLGVSSQAYADAVAMVPVVEEARFPVILRFLRSMAHEIARRGLTGARAQAASIRAEQLLAHRTDEARAAESRLFRIAALVPGVLYQYRLWPNGRSAFPYASDGIQDIYGVTPDQVREDALPIVDVLHTDDVDRIMASILHSARTLTVWQEQYRVSHPTKGEIWVEGRSQPEPLPDGSVLWHGLIVDITGRVRQEETLRAVQDRYRMVARALRYGTWDVNLKTGVFDVDPGFFEMLGYPENAFPVTFEAWLEMLHPDDASTVWERAMNQFADSDSFCLEVRYCASDGKWLWVEMRGRVLERRDDRPLRIVGTNIDINDRKTFEAALRASKEQFRALHEKAGVAYIAFDRDGRILEANTPFCSLFGETPQNVRGRSIHHMLAPGSRAERPEDAGRISALLDGSGDGGDLTLVRPDGLEITVHVKAWVQRAPDGSLSRVHWIVHDISEHTRLEARLARSNTDLSQFAYAVSHDLREPLRMVGGFLGLIDRRLGPDIDPEVREWMAFASDGARRMNAMILDLLEYSRAGSAEIDALPVSLTAVVDEALQNLTAAIAERNARVTVNGHLPLVVGDHPQLVRLMQNLVGNAVKFVPADRVPEISIACADEAGATWAVSVADNGSGIPADQRDKAFGVFQRLDAQRETAGTGVGLALCKKIVERHGGTIAIDDAPTGGAVIRFTLPKRGLTWTQRAESRTLPIADLVNMLNMHQMRIVSRMRNLSHTVRERGAPAQTAQGEAEFLVQEVEAYRVFVHAHGDDLFGERPASADEDMLAESDSLMFSVNRWLQNQDPERRPGAVGWQSMSSILPQMLDHVRRTHDQLVRQRSQRVASSGDRLRT